MSKEIPQTISLALILSSLTYLPVETISSPHKKVKLLFGLILPSFTSLAVKDAISKATPTPEALSFAPGSWICELKTKRFLGCSLPLTSATMVNSSEA